MQVLTLLAEMRLESPTFIVASEKLAVGLRELRQERGVSQEELADLAGCLRTYVGMLERKQVNPSLAILTALADALNVDVHRLLQ